MRADRASVEIFCLCLLLMIMMFSAWTYMIWAGWDPHYQYTPLACPNPFET